MDQRLKERFFAQYIYCCEFGEKGEDFIADLNDSAMIDFFGAEQEDAFLLLRPISSLTAEESILIAKMARPKSEWLHEMPYAKTFCTKDILHAHPSTFLDSMEVTDYLRSIGVALPWMGHSVEKMVECGWIKLTEKG